MQNKEEQMAHNRLNGLTQKQTAVEWLFEELDNELELYNSQWLKIEKIIKQAKEMEKQQQKRYSEDEVISILYEQLEALDFYGSDFKFADWFEKVKKK